VKKLQLHGCQKQATSSPTLPTLQGRVNKNLEWNAQSTCALHDHAVLKNNSCQLDPEFQASSAPFKAIVMEKQRAMQGRWNSVLDHMEYEGDCAYDRETSDRDLIHDVPRKNEGR
jgi:hypothetical protein